jgi:choline-sulfatase
VVRTGLDSDPCRVAPTGCVFSPRQSAPPKSAAGRRSRLILSALLTVGMACACQRTEGTRPDIILIVLDTVRADRIGSFSPKGSAQTPNLDALATRSRSWPQAIATAPLTMPSMAAIFTGRHGDAVGVIGHSAQDRLDGDADTLASLAHDAGYATAAVVTNPWLARRPMGFLRDFDAVITGRTAGGSGARMSASHVTDAALRAVDSIFAGDRSTDRPLLLWAHYMDAHMPYDTGQAETEPNRLLREFSAPGSDRQKIYFAPPYTETERAATRAAYDAAVHSIDREIGRLLEGLRDRGRASNAIIVVVSDHGEALGEHGLHFAHDFTVYDELIRAVFMISASGLPVGLDHSPVSTVDLLPTLCSLAALRCPANLGGLDLTRDRASAHRALFAASAPRRDRYARAPWLTVDGPEGRMTAIRKGTMKLVRTPGQGGVRTEVFDLSTDPGEQMNIYDRELHAGMNQSLDAWLERMEKLRGDRPVRSARPRGNRLREELRLLGYVD